VKFAVHCPTSNGFSTKRLAEESYESQFPPICQNSEMHCEAEEASRQKSRLAMRHADSRHLNFTVVVAVFAVRVV
jgi:hypothetical protein